LKKYAIKKIKVDKTVAVLNYDEQKKATLLMCRSELMKEKFRCLCLRL